MWSSCDAESSFTCSTHPTDSFASQEVKGFSTLLLLLLSDIEASNMPLGASVLFSFNQILLSSLRFHVFPGQPWPTLLGTRVNSHEHAFAWSRWQMCIRRKRRCAGVHFLGKRRSYSHTLHVLPTTPQWVKKTKKKPGS